MSGITRIKIQSNWNDWRTRLAEAHESIANQMYRAIFTLADGDMAMKVTKDDTMARYDWKEGIDVILTTVNGTRMTLQEKFLTFSRSTVTFEEKKTDGSAGAWYYCTAQYYFVGYTRRYWDWRNHRLYQNPVVDFQDYILLDLAALHRADEQGALDWKYNENKKDGRGATFRFLYFDEVPEKCIIHRRPVKTIQPVRVI